MAWSDSIIFYKDFSFWILLLYCILFTFSLHVALVLHHFGMHKLIQILYVKWSERTQTHIICDLVWIVHFVCIISQFDEWICVERRKNKKKSNIFDFPQNKRRNSQRIIMFLLFPVVGAAAAAFLFVFIDSFLFIFFFIPFKLWITNQLFGYRHCTDARRMDAKKTRSQMPFGSQANFMNAKSINWNCVRVGKETEEKKNTHWFE